MAEGKNTLIGFLVVGAIVGSLCAGFLARNRAEMGSLASKKPLGIGLLATTDKFAETTESEYFYEVAELLKQHYVEPVDIDQKMTSGAIRGMVASLLDPESNFYDPTQFIAYNASLNGKYEGIGVEIDYRFIESELEKLQSGTHQPDSLLLLPQIFITSVMPGSPADKAGLKSGDEVKQVQGKYVVTGKDIKRLRDLQTAVTEKKADSKELDLVRADIQKKVENIIQAPKVRTHLTNGAQGEVQIIIDRNGKEMPFNLLKEVTKVDPIVTGDNNEYFVRFFKGLNSELSELNLAQPITLNLTNSGAGDFTEMETALAYFLDQGIYGQVLNEKGKVVRQIEVKATKKSQLNIRLKVDQSTIGAAATFAHILAENNVAVLEGTLPPVSSWLDVQTLPDGSGYTLAIGKYKNSKFESNGEKNNQVKKDSQK